MSCCFIIGSQPSSLATEVARLLGSEAAPVRITVFENGEKRIQLPMSVADKDVFVFQTTTANPDAIIFETLRTIDAAKCSGAKSITVIFPCYPYARQDKMLGNGCGIPPRLIAKLLKTAGADRLVTVDLHAPKQAEKFALPTCNLLTEALFADYLCKQANKTDEILLFAPDRGALPRVQSIARTLGCDFGWANKQRSADGTLILSDFHGDIRGKCVCVIDDRIDTGNTLVSVVTRLKHAGAKRIVGMVTHGVDSRVVLTRLKAEGLDKLIETDTREVIRDATFTDILPVAPLLADGLKKFSDITGFFDCQHTNTQ